MRGVNEDPLLIGGISPDGMVIPAKFNPDGSLSSLDPQNAAYTRWPAILPSIGPTPPTGTYTLPPSTRNLSAYVTSSGMISMVDDLGNVKTFPLMTGLQTLPFLPVTFTTTATATFWADR